MSVNIHLTSSTRHTNLYRSSLPPLALIVLSALNISAQTYYFDIAIAVKLVLSLECLLLRQGI